jgi:hypothetical protein
LTATSTEAGRKVPVGAENQEERATEEEEEVRLPRFISARPFERRIGPDLELDLPFD